jgi:hypothetical protein
MKTFLLRLCAFALIPLVFSAGLSLILEPRYYRPYLKGVPAGTKVLLLADSHGGALGTLLADDGVFNFSHAGDSYHDMLRKLRYAVRTTPSLSLVVITADDHTLSLYRERLNNADRSIHYTRPGDPDALVANRYDDFKIRVVKRGLPVLNAKGRDVAVTLLNAWGGKAAAAPGDDTDWGHTPNRGEEARGRVERQYPGPEASASLRRALEDIVTTARARGVRVVGLRFPLSGDYLTHLGARGFGADSVLRALNVEVLDHRGLYRDADSLFKDQDHLNRRGARAFASLLRAELTPRLVPR